MTSPAVPLLKVSELAAELRVSPRTIRCWIEAGEVAAVRVRGTVRIPISERDRLLVPTTTAQIA